MALQGRRDKIIEGRTYSILLPPVTQCLPLCNRTAVLLAPVLAGGLGAAVPSAVEAEKPGTLVELVKRLGPALVALTDALGKADPVTTHSVMMDAVQAAHLSCDGAPVFNPVDFDRHFADYRSDAYPVLTWALWECVKDFFPKLEGSPLQALSRVAKDAWKSQMGGAQTTGSEG